MKTEPHLLRTAAMEMNIEVPQVASFIEDHDIKDAVAAVYYRHAALWRQGIDSRDLGPQRALVKQFVNTLTEAEMSSSEALPTLRLVFRAIFIHDILDAGKKSPLRLRIEMLWRRPLDAVGLYERMRLVGGTATQTATAPRDHWSEVIASRLRLMRDREYGKPPTFQSELSDMGWPRGKSLAWNVFVGPIAIVLIGLLAFFNGILMAGHWRESRRHRKGVEAAIKRYERFEPEDFLGVRSFKYLWNHFGFKDSEADEPLRKQLLNAWLLILYKGAIDPATIDKLLEDVYRNRGQANSNTSGIHFSFGPAIDDVVEELNLPLPSP